MQELMFLCTLKCKNLGKFGFLSEDFFFVKNHYKLSREASIEVKGCSSLWQSQDRDRWEENSKTSHGAQRKWNSVLTEDEP